MDLQEACFFQPDTYYGYHNGELPGRVQDRLETVTPEYLAVVMRGRTLPLYFYDYTVPWDSSTFEEDGSARNEFGLVNPETHAPRESDPVQVDREDASVETEISGDRILIRAESKTEKKKLVTAVFDVPYESGFTAAASKPDVKLRQIRDPWTGNVHLFADLGRIAPGVTEIVVRLSGTPRTPVPAEDLRGPLGAMWFGEKAYLRCTDRDAAFRVELPAPEEARLRLVSGETLSPRDGVLRFDLNLTWENEAPILLRYPRARFREALECAVFTPLGKTGCSRWSGQ